MANLVPLRRFWRGLCTNWIGTAGVVLTTTSFVLFVGAEALRLLGVLTNAYVGLITYLALPALFVLGLGLIPVGWWRYRRQSGRTTRELLDERFDAESVAPRRSGSRVVQTIAILTLVNVLFLGAGALRTLHFMDQPRFCGTACHSVMSPEWTAYQHGPHSRVKCVSCHVGEGAGAAIDAKLNGVWQMVSVTFDLYERPIPTPVHNLSPADETCAACHAPTVEYGERVKTIVHHATDRPSTPRYNTVVLNVGSGRGTGHGIHWHAAARVRFQPVDRRRLAVRWVEVARADGSRTRYVDRRHTSPPPHLRRAASPPVRTMDCVDCHNRPAHAFDDPAEAVDRLIAAGAIDRDLPFAKRQALAALTGSFRADGVLAAIARDFRGFYRRQHPLALQKHGREIDAAVAALQQLHRRNIHPRMKIGWNAYPDHLGHRRGPGCRRCHTPELTDAAGKPMPHDCTLCHSLLAYDSAHPFEVLLEASPQQRERTMLRYLRREYLRGR